MSQGHILSVREDCKHSTHSDDCREVGTSFVPLLMEIIGGWSEMASQTIISIGRLLGQCLGSNSEDTTHHLFQRLSIFLWWGNLTMWFARSPTLLFLLMVSYNNYNNNNNDNDNNNNDSGNGDNNNTNTNNNNNNNNNGCNTCCKCNGSNAKCKRCDCVKKGKPCVNCVPIHISTCHNTVTLRQERQAHGGRSPLSTCSTTQGTLPVSSPPSQSQSSFLSLPLLLNTPSEESSIQTST